MPRILIVLLLAANAAAATRPVPTSGLDRYSGLRPHYRPRPVPYPPPGYSFAMEIITNGGPEAESSRNGRPYIQVHEGEEYSIRLHNPLPVRVGVNLQVDGLNTISGRPGRPGEGSLWLISPHSQITISGWQVDTGHARRFVFTTREGSYARWQRDRFGTDQRDIGKISAAFFWSRAELEAAYHEEEAQPYSTRHAGLARAEKARRAPSFDEAGTGMGERVGHPIVATEFHFDSGMYDPEGAVTITYGFSPVYEPRRVWEGHHDRTGFAPEMPAYPRPRLR